jgi:hypothetical protein
VTGEVSNARDLGGEGLGESSAGTDEYVGDEVSACRVNVPGIV